MKTSLKKAILFSTLAFGTLEFTSAIKDNATPIVHADTVKTQNDQSNNVVASEFSDPGMQAVILSSAQNQYGSNRIKTINDITQADLDGLTSLTYGNGWDSPIKITSLTNVDLLTNLTSINISKATFDSNINLAPIKKLTQLKSLSLVGTGITSAMIANLNGYDNPNLNTINLTGNKITDINFIKTITIPNVQEVNISYNSISDFSPIEGVNWPQLTKLNASNNNISDISPIAKVSWPNLKELNASNNNITDISVIKDAEWPLIDSINVSNNNISDINPISSANWPNLEYITADNNHIKNINSFVNTNWTKLKSISVNNNDISNIDAMKDSYKKFTTLGDFSVDNNQINDLSFMQGFTFNGGSANGQSIVKSVSLPKLSNNQTVSIPISLVDLDLSNNYIGAAVKNPSKQFLMISNLHDSGLFTIIGKDGKPYSESSDESFSNGIDHINFTYHGGDLPNSVNFQFSSTLNTGTTYFSGSYTVYLNWQDNSTTITPNTTGTSTNNDKTIDSHKNNSGNPDVNYGKVIATRGLNLYKKNSFTKKNKIKTYKRSFGNKRPLFKVLKKATSSIGTPRYYVTQINPFTNKEIKNSRGYITAKSNYVTPLYYTTGVKEVRITSKTVTAYKKANLKDSFKKYKQGTILKVKSIKKHGNAYSLQLQNGKFVTANKYFVIKVK